MWIDWERTFRHQFRSTSSLLVCLVVRCWDHDRKESIVRWNRIEWLDRIHSFHHHHSNRCPTMNQFVVPRWSSFSTTVCLLWDFLWIDVDVFCYFPFVDVDSMVEHKQHKWCEMRWSYYTLSSSHQVEHWSNKLVLDYYKDKCRPMMIDLLHNKTRRSIDRNENVEFVCLSSIYLTARSTVRKC